MGTLSSVINPTSDDPTPAPAPSPAPSSDSSIPDISLIVPALNEALNLPELAKQVQAALAGSDKAAVYLGSRQYLRGNPL